MNHVADFGEMVAREFSLETFRYKRDMHRLQDFEDALPKLLARLDDLRPICARLWAKREKALKHYATRHDAKLIDEELRQPAAEYYELIAQVNLIQAELPALCSKVHGTHVAIVGSRDYPRLEDVARFVSLLPDNAVVISGGARGVDAAAEQAARVRGLEVVVFPADWNTHGKRAGFVRNADIVNACDWLAAFHYNASQGTAHSIELARKAGKHVIVYAGETTDNG